MRRGRHAVDIFVVWLLILRSLSSLHYCAGSHSCSLARPECCPVLYLLNVQPYPVRDELAIVWDRAYELIPAGHLAAEEINNRSDILPGHELKLIDVDSEACGINTISKGIANVVKELVNRRCIVGVVGLFCSPVTNVISPIVSHPNIGGYVQIAASTLPILRGKSTTSNRFHIIGSSGVFNEATIALMSSFGWRKVSSVYDSRLYFRTTANDFVKATSEAEYELTTRILLSERLIRDVDTVFTVLNDNGARISFWSVSFRQATFLLCEAFRKNFMWPGYVYIIQEHSAEQLLLHQSQTTCSKEEIMIAMEGVFTLQYRLYVENDTKLESGVTYSEYKKLYRERLQEFAARSNESLEEDNAYANSQYDQVWAFALAVNNSLPDIISQNLSFQDYEIGNPEQILSTTIIRKLQKVSFRGASGQIHFGNNQESPSYVNIFQIRKGIPIHVGIYDPFKKNVTFTGEVANVPKDTFETVYVLIPLWLAVCMLLAQSILFVIITTNFVLLIKWRRLKEIKATSPLLSTLMVIGCYSLCSAPIFLALNRVLIIESVAVRTTLCYFETWTSIGIELILATLLFKLLRIYHIFHAKQMTMMSDYWTDKYLFIYTLLVCIGKVVLLIVWNSVEPIRSETSHKYIPAGPDGIPYYRTSVRCKQSSVWEPLSLLYSGVLLLSVVVLAIETRHVKNDLYKDTKKVNIFIFCVLITLAVTYPLSIIFGQVGINVGTNVSEWLTYLAIPMLCQVCLLTPKTLPLAIKIITKKEIKDFSIHVLRPHFSLTSTINTYA